MLVHMSLACYRLELGLGFGLRLVAYIMRNLLLLLCVTRALYKDSFLNVKKKSESKMKTKYK